MPDSNLADGSALTSAFYNTYIREQVVVTCTSATRPSGVEGRVIYETDTDLLLVYDGSSWVEAFRRGAWATWTPTVTQSGSVTVTNTRSRYIQIGKMVTASFNLSVTGSGTGSNAVSISVPVTAAASGPAVGTATLFDSSANLRYPAVVRLASSGAIQLVAAGGTSTSDLGAVTFTAGLASGDQLLGTFTYEAA